MKEETDIHKELIKKVLEGRATSEEKKLLSETEAVKHRMRQQWEQSNGKEADNKIGEKMWKQIDKRCQVSSQKKRLYFTLMPYAACASLLLLLGSLWFILEHKINTATEYENILAKTHQELTLPDNSKIWMQPGSSLRYAKGFSRAREVWLTGDAIFEVTRKEKNPFKVHIGQTFIEVKGTAFRVESRQQSSCKVTLFNGRVNFHTATGQEISMRPQQCLTYHQDGKSTLESVENINWQNGVYKFKDIPLYALIHIVKKIYGIDIQFSNEVPTQHLFTGHIRYDERPSEVIEKICYNMNLKYKRKQSNFIIYKQ